MACEIWWCLAIHNPCTTLGVQFFYRMFGQETILGSKCLFCKIVFINVYLCYLFLQMFTTVYLCMFTLFTRECLPMFTQVYLCLPMFNMINLASYLCLLIFTRV